MDCCERVFYLPLAPSHGLGYLSQRPISTHRTFYHRVQRIQLSLHRRRLTSSIRPSNH